MCDSISLGEPRLPNCSTPVAPEGSDVASSRSDGPPATGNEHVLDERYLERRRDPGGCVNPPRLLHDDSDRDCAPEPLAEENKSAERRRVKRDGGTCVQPATPTRFPSSHHFRVGGRADSPVKIGQGLQCCIGSLRVNGAPSSQITTTL